MKSKSTIPSEILDPRGPMFALVEHEIAGLEVLDRDVVVTTAPTERRANWVGVDGDARLVFVLFVEAGDETAAQLVLATCAFGADGLLASAKRWRSANVRVDLAPRVVVIAPSFTTRTLRALSFLARDTLIVLELRSLERASGAERFLVRIHATSAEASAGRAFDAWPASVRDTLERLSRDVKRIDPEIDERVQSDTLRWSWRGDEIAHVSSVDGVLIVGEAKTRAKIALDDQPRREAWLERFLVEHCERRSAVRHSARPLDLLDRSSEPLLSAAELAAFRD
ncbi:MAG: hypothetical protein SGI72_01315 [Planctomycetota bacterium]|nr:hypothetical protein [Planctomycetota bacterium]